MRLDVSAQVLGCGQIILTWRYASDTAKRLSAIIAEGGLEEGFDRVVIRGKLLGLWFSPQVGAVITYKIRGSCIVYAVNGEIAVSFFARLCGVVALASGVMLISTDVQVADFLVLSAVGSVSLVYFLACARCYQMAHRRAADQIIGAVRGCCDDFSELAGESRI